MPVLPPVPCESFHVLKSACTVWTFCPLVYFENISVAQYLSLKRESNCSIALDPTLSCECGARTDSSVTGVFTGVFVRRCRDRCCEEPSGQPDVHSSSLWKVSRVLNIRWRRRRGDRMCPVSLFECAVIFGFASSFQHQFAWHPFSRTLVCKGGSASFHCTCDRVNRVSEPLLRCCVTPREKQLRQALLDNIIIECLHHYCRS